MKLINLIRRACLLFVIWSLEIHLADQKRAIRSAISPEEFKKVFAAKVRTEDELAAARNEYSALLPVGTIKVWAR